MMQSPEDSPFSNLWDEICFQQKTWESYYWEYYEDYIESILEKSISRLCLKEEIIMLWMQSDEYENESDEYDDYEIGFMEKGENIRDFFYNKYSIDGAVQTVKHCLLEAAENYTNQKIEKAISNEYSF